MPEHFTIDPMLALRIPREYRRLFERLADVMVEQERRYGPFDSCLGQVRLGIAVLQDELDEALEAWRDERRRDHWMNTGEEIMQVAAVAIRLLRDMNWTSDEQP